MGLDLLVNVPIVVALAAAALLVPESRDPAAPRVDVVGALLSTVGLVALLFGIIEGPSRGGTDTTVVGAFGPAVVLLVGFVFWERAADHPILDLSFFRNPRFTGVRCPRRRHHRPRRRAAP